MPMPGSPLFDSTSSAPGLPRWLGRFRECALFAVVFLMPLWFLPQTLDILELNKQTVLLVGAMVGVLAWFGKILVERRARITWNWLHIAVGLYLAGYLLVSLAAPDRYLALAGNVGQMPWAFAAALGFAAVYALIALVPRDVSRVYRLVFAFLGSSTAAALLGLFQMGGLKVFRFATAGIDTTYFNTIGTANAFAGFMAIPLVVSAALLLFGCDDARCLLSQRSKGSSAAFVLTWASLLSSFAVLVAVAFNPAWYAAFIGLAVLAVFATVADRRWFRQPAKAAIPAAIVILGAVAMVWKNPLRIPLPLEVSPSLAHSWAISKRVLDDEPLFGMGPGAWIYAYARYREPAVNVSAYWTIRFERGISVFPTVVGMLGLVGTAFWLLLIGSGLATGVRSLARDPDLDRRTATLVVFSGWATVLAVAGLHQFNMPHAFAFWFFFGLLSSLVARDAAVWDGMNGRRSVFVAGSAAFAVLSVAAICVAWLSGQRLAADMEYSRAVSAYSQGEPIDASIERLKTASSLNRWNDVYPRNLSQAYLIKLNQATGALSGSAPSAEDQKKIGEAMQEMFHAAQSAVDLNPSNVDNFSNLAILAEAVASFTPGADERAIAAFRRALELEPANALFHNELGKILVMRADAYGTRASDADPKVRDAAKAAQQDEWAKAEVELAKAIELKPDLAAAHYNLGILYERQGRVKQAVLKLEQVLMADDRDVGIAFQLGILYYRDGQKEKAVRMFEQILRLDPQYLNARWFLAAMYEEKGMFNEAIAQLMLVDESLPQNAQVQQAVARLKAQRDAGKKPSAKPLPEPIEQDVSGPGDLNPIKP